MKKTDSVIIDDKKNKKISKNTIVAVISVLILVLGYVFFIRPMRTEIKELTANGSSMELKNSVSLKKQQLARMKRALANAEELNPTIDEKLMRGLPDTPELYNAIINMVALFNESGIEVESIGFAEKQEDGKRVSLAGAPEQDDGKAKEISVKVGVEQMTYTKLKKLFVNSEKSLRLVRIDKFSFSSGQTSGFMELTVFYLP